MPNLQSVSICIAVSLMFCMLVVGPVVCSMVENRNITERVQAACSGDLKSIS